MFCTKCGHVINQNSRFCESCGAENSPNQQAQAPYSTHHHKSDYIGRYRSGISVIVLSIITCGIYGYYWLYVTMEDVNFALGERRINSGALLLGSILCAPIFIWVALYQIDKHLFVLAKEEGIYYSENFVLWIILGIFTGVGMFIAYYQASEGLNALWDKRRGVTSRYHR